ncbi:WhiB family transcriptional regulator [Streptomyces yanii]|uniref:Transcriptional regulator WhiB n=1 Tax=Streptomyces yanii TaxID=78510 RepID=A0ABV5R5M9_9ACTN
MDWVDRGLCRTQPERMFAEGAAQNEAKTVCFKCPVQLDCLAYALDHREEHGVWGAMTERERRSLLRRRPGVASWAEVFRAGTTHREPELEPEPVRVSRPGRAPAIPAAEVAKLRAVSA